MGEPFWIGDDWYLIVPRKEPKMKPHEETWRWNEEFKVIEAHRPDIRIDDDDRAWETVVETDFGTYAPKPGERELIVAAPDMARVLLAIEWAGEDNLTYPEDCMEPTCPCCGGFASPPQLPTSDTYPPPPPPKHHVGHAPDCALDAALRKAGVR